MLRCALDPIAPHPRYECAVNVEDLIRLEDVMEQHTLGPNGGTTPRFLFVSFSFLISFFISFLGGSPESFLSQKPFTPHSHELS